MKGKKKIKLALASFHLSVSKTVGPTQKQQLEACVSGGHGSQVSGTKVSLLLRQEAKKSHVPSHPKHRVWRKIPSPEEGRVSRVMQVGD